MLAGDVGVVLGVDECDMVWASGLGVLAEVDEVFDVVRRRSIINNLIIYISVFINVLAEKELE